MFQNNTVYFNGTHVGYIAAASTQPVHENGLTSSAIAGIAAALCALAALAAVVLAFAIRKRNRKEAHDTRMSMKSASFDRYLNEMEAAQVQRGGMPANGIFKTTPLRPTSASNVFAAAPPSGWQRNDMQLSNPSLDAKKNSAEFTFAPHKNVVPINRFSTTLYQNKMQPHKKVMMPVMSNNIQKPFAHLKFTA